MCTPPMPREQRHRPHLHRPGPQGVGVARGGPLHERAGAAHPLPRGRPEFSLRGRKPIQQHRAGLQQGRAGRKLLCGGGGDTEAHFPNPPPLLGRRDGRGGSGRGCPTCRAGGGGSTQHLWLKMIPRRADHFDY